MKFRLTEHAQERIHQRSISLNAIIETIEFPEKIEKQGSKWTARKQIIKGHLEVVYEKTDNIIKIITAYWV